MTTSPAKYGPTKHPTDAVLTDYVSGSLRQAFSAVVAAHLEHCADCRVAVSGLEAIGGALIESLPAGDMDAERLIEAMAALDKPGPKRAQEGKPTEGRVPFGGELWLSPGMGIRRARRAGKGKDLLYLLRLPAGQITLPHGHNGVEFTTVLKGAYKDGDQIFAAGDFCELDASCDHQPQVQTDGECVCMIASERPMRTTTRIGRIVQALTGV